MIADPCTIWLAGSTHGCLSKGWERWNEKQACQFKNSTFSPPTLLLRPGVDEGQIRELLLLRLLVCRWGGHSQTRKKSESHEFLNPIVGFRLQQ